MNIAPRTRADKEEGGFVACNWVGVSADTLVGYDGRRGAVYV